jgi:alkylation response protein AidB-like acyl-CoA dehydrogenase
MNFELTEDQKMIRKTARDYVKKELPIERTRKMRQDELGFSRAVWKHMGELGWLGISLPDSVGGFGGAFVDAALILGELGATLVSEPYTASAIVAGHALCQAGNGEQHARWLAPMVAGDATLALAYAEQGSRFDVSRVATTAHRSADGWHLRGEKVWVDNGHAADAIIVSARTSGGATERQGISLFVVEAGDEGLARTTVKTMDGRRAGTLRFDCHLGADRLLGGEGTAIDVLDRAMDLGAAAGCSEGAAVMGTALSMTVEYLKTREQFGVKIGSFQALQHRAVDMFIETELARSMAIMAAIKVDEPDALERRRAVSAAKAQLSVSGKYVTQQAIQLHGGIGVTEEHDIGLYFKRMHVLGVLYGDEEHHVARYMGLPGFTQGL